jgi:anti-sigma regulatory factor (Ser/Thr protein kinase)
VADLVPLEGLRDDVAIVALQNSPVPAELHLRLPAEPATLAQVRRILRRWLVEQGAGEADVAEVTIAVSEACANAIEHAYSPAPATFELDAWEEDGGVAIAVRDHGRWRESRGEGRGRGLSIIAAAMDDVQVNRPETGTEVVMRRHLSHR